MPSKRLSAGFPWQDANGLVEEENEGIGHLLGLRGLSGGGAGTMKDGFRVAVAVGIGDNLPSIEGTI